MGGLLTTNVVTAIYSVTRWKTLLYNISDLSHDSDPKIKYAQDS